MVRFLKLLIIAPIAILFLIFAFANRQFVTVSFDPFDPGNNPAYSLEAPLFILLILSMMLGVLMGGVAVWFGQGKHRRSARENRAARRKAARRSAGREGRAAGAVEQLFPARVSAGRAIDISRRPTSTPRSIFPLSSMRSPKPFAAASSRRSAIITRSRAPANLRRRIF